VDAYFLAEQMGTSVKMIEDHYGHANTIRHADRVLQGMAGWEPLAAYLNESDAKASKAAATRDKAVRPATATPRRQRSQPRWPAIPRPARTLLRNRPPRRWRP
jgi:hypothetical protein